MNHPDHRPFYSLSDFYKERYGEKVYKIAIDAGFTCPNRDGLIDTKGCVFCSQEGSGDFCASRDLDMATRIIEGKSLILSKSKASKFIVYFQAFTNTYDTVENLNSIYQSALIDDSIVGLSIATRPDCLNPDIINLLKEFNQITDIYVELGLQTIHDESAHFIRRGYPLSVYDNAVHQLSEAQIPIITHVIIGLPYESFEDILKTVQYVCNGPIQGIKLQLLHILTDTDLYNYYLEQPFFIYSAQEYVDILIKLIEYIPPSIVLHRLTGDGPSHLLFEPRWSLNKRFVLNLISKQFKAHNTYQGRLWTTPLTKGGSQ